MSKRKEVFKLTKLKKDNFRSELTARVFLSNFVLNNVEYHELHLFATLNDISITLRNNDWRIDPVSYSREWKSKHWYFRMEHDITLTNEVKDIIHSIRSGKIPEWLGQYPLTYVKVLV